ncbi:MAG TPA: hypothetical protein DCY20_02480 [Firmicutes bacterium]|nr:hypothetical protein [Bacillota bacterium]
MFLVFVGMMKYDATTAADASLNEIIMQLPIIMGTGRVNLSKTSGCYGILYLYPALLLLGANILTKEEIDKISEFLYVKQISRQQILTNKLLVALTNVCIFMLVTDLSSLMAIQLFGRGESFTQDVNLLMIGLTLIEILFLSICFCLGATLKKPKLASSVTTSIILITFMLSMAIDMVKALDYPPLNILMRKK